MKDFPYWRDEIQNAKTPLLLKLAGEELAKFQRQIDMLNPVPGIDGEQAGILRKMYAVRMQKLKAEYKDVPGANRPEFHK